MLFRVASRTQCNLDWSEPFFFLFSLRFFFFEYENVPTISPQHRTHKENTSLNSGAHVESHQKSGTLHAVWNRLLQKAIYSPSEIDGKRYIEHKTTFFFLSFIFDHIFVPSCLYIPSYIDKRQKLFASFSTRTDFCWSNVVARGDFHTWTVEYRYGDGRGRSFQGSIPLHPIWEMYLYFYAIVP